LPDKNWTRVFIKLCYIETKLALVFIFIVKLKSKDITNNIWLDL
jgi:hypothetical protein